MGLPGRCNPGSGVGPPAPDPMGEGHPALTVRRLTRARGLPRPGPPQEPPPLPEPDTPRPPRARAGRMPPHPPGPAPGFGALTSASRAVSVPRARPAAAPTHCACQAGPARLEPDPAGRAVTQARGRSACEVPACGRGSGRWAGPRRVRPPRVGVAPCGGRGLWPQVGADPQPQPQPQSGSAKEAGDGRRQVPYLRRLFRREWRLRAASRSTAGPPSGTDRAHAQRSAYFQALLQGCSPQEAGKPLLQRPQLLPICLPTTWTPI